MTILGSHATSSTVHRLVPAVLLGASIAFASVVTGATPIAGAEWDIGQYDRCVANVKFQYREGDISTADMIIGYNTCCTLSGGQLDGNNCGAPPAIVTGAPAGTPSEAANPDVPAGPPPSTTKPAPKAPKTTFTLAPVAPVG